MTQKELIFGYFVQNPYREIEHSEIVDWATEEWLRVEGKKFRDPDRAIRTLYQEGVLEKVRTGVYRYDPANVAKVNTREFSAASKKEIFARDGHVCVMCGRGRRDGLTLHADHIIPRDKGGSGDAANGQTLCSECNMLKKNYGQVEFGRKFLEKNLQTAKDSNDLDSQMFFEEVLAVFDRFGR